MIAHRIQKKKGGASFERLACYVVGAKDKRDPAVFDRIASYIADSRGGDDRVVGLRITNCRSEDFRISVDEIMHTQAANKRAKGDKSYHLVISFPEGERPTVEQLRDIEDRLCEAIGYGDHQRISAIHDDTDNLHVHIAINKVHPQTMRCVEPYYDHPKLMAACIELEIKHGLIRDNHGRVDEKQLSQGAAKMEAFSGRETLQAWIVANCAAELRDGLAQCKSWQDVHKQFAEYGLTLKPRGAGLVVGVHGLKASVKASSVARDLSFETLTNRFGDYQPAGPDVAKVEARQKYDRRPRLKSPEAEALFDRYKRERQAAELARSAGRQNIQEALFAFSAELKAAHREQSREIRDNLSLQADEKRRLRQAAQSTRRLDWTKRRELGREELAKLHGAIPLLTWPAFLEREASAGDEQALRTLRSMSKGRRRFAANILTADNVEEARHVLDDQHKRTVKRNGDVVYTIRDGGRITDKADEVRLDALSTGAALLALSLAAERFEGQALVLEGTEDFKAAIVEVAALPGFQVTFADPEMQKAMEIAQRERAERDQARAVGGVAGYVAARNQLRERVEDVLEHRAWSVAEVGVFQYAGRRSFEDGSEAVLLRRDDTIFVKIATDAQMAKASKFARGSEVVVDSQGRFRSEAPKKAAEREITSR